MRSLLRVALIGLAATVIPSGLCHAEFDICHSPLTFNEADPALTITAYGVQYQAIKVTSTSPATNRLISLGLVLPDDVVIDGVSVCYEISNNQNYVSGIRLTSMTTPNSFVVLHDDPSLLTDVGAHCYRSDVGGAVVSGTITLTLELDYYQSNAYILIGAITIHVSQVGSSMEEREGNDTHDRILLVPNRPNPSGAPTEIGYRLERSGPVELQICDVGGRLVRSLFTGELSAGDHRSVWDLRDDGGRSVPSGTYYLFVRMGDQIATGGVVVVR